jgi:hypothetical protein
MAKLSDEALAEARTLLAQVPRGPWRWYGNTKRCEVYLATVHGGRIFVMDFARWGMQGGQPRFQLRANGQVSGVDSQWGGTGYMHTLRALAEQHSPHGPAFEGVHTTRFTGIGHPVARLIEQAPTLLGALLDHVAELQLEVSRLQARVSDLEPTR